MLKWMISMINLQKQIEKNPAGVSLPPQNQKPEMEYNDTVHLTSKSLSSSIDIDRLTGTTLELEVNDTTDIAPADARASNGRTALHEAAIKGHLACVQWLLRESRVGGVGGAGASLHTEAIDGSNAVLFAAKGGHLKVLQWLVVEQGTWSYIYLPELRFLYSHVSHYLSFAEEISCLLCFFQAWIQTQLIAEAQRACIGPQCVATQS